MKAEGRKEGGGGGEALFSCNVVNGIAAGRDIKRVVVSFRCVESDAVT